jgi:serine/threonine-protein kinase
MRVVVADDSLLTREGIVHVLGRSGVEVVGEAGDARALLAMVSTTKPDAAHPHR